MKPATVRAITDTCASAERKDDSTFRVPWGGEASRMRYRLEQLIDFCRGVVCVWADPHERRDVV